MFSCKRFVGVMALAALLSLAALVPQAGAYPPPKKLPPPTNKYVALGCQSLGITYLPTANGCKVTRADNVVPFADGSFLEKNDIVLSVGGVSTKGTTINLEDKIQLAYANGNTEIVVLDHNTGQVFSFNLP